MNQKELTKTFMMISNWNNNILVSMVFQHFSAQRVNGLGHRLVMDVKKTHSPHLQRSLSTAGVWSLSLTVNINCLRTRTGQTHPLTAKACRNARFNPFSAGTVFRRQNLTSVDVRFWRLKTIHALIEITKYIMAVDPWHRYSNEAESTD